MGKFFYKAKKGLNEIVEGTLEAQSEEEALNALSSQGLFPVYIEPFTARGQHVQSAKKRTVKKRFLWFRRGVSQAQILIFAQKLATLVRAKVELMHALKIVYEQTENGIFRNIILDIYNSTREGKAFSESLTHYSDIFSPLFINIIRAGEASGSLEDSLTQINQFLSREQSLRAKVAVALAYPALLLFIGIASVFVLINFVLPKLQPIFETTGQELPVITKIMFSISSASKEFFWLVLLVFAAGAFFLYSQRTKPFIRNTAHAIKIRLPIVKNIIKNQELVHFSRSLGLLLKSGVTPLKSLEIISNGVVNVTLSKELKEVCANVAAGRGLAESILGLTILPSFFTKMIAVGEQSGRLSEVLDEISHSYTEQVERDIALVSSLLEPLLILVMGLILGTIVLSILIPIFKVTQLVQ